MTAVVAAVRMVLHHIFSLRNLVEVVILADSCCALKLLLYDDLNSLFVREVANAYRTLEDSRRFLFLEWVPPTLVFLATMVRMSSLRPLISTNTRQSLLIPPRRPGALCTRQYLCDLRTQVWIREVLHRLYQRNFIGMHVLFCTGFVQTAPLHGLLFTNLATLVLRIVFCVAPLKMGRYRACTMFVASLGTARRCALNTFHQNRHPRASVYGTAFSFRTSNEVRQSFAIPFKFFRNGWTSRHIGIVIDNLKITAVPRVWHSSVLWQSTVWHSRSFARFPFALWLHDFSVCIFAFLFQYWFRIFFVTIIVMADVWSHYESQSTWDFFFLAKLHTDLQINMWENIYYVEE